MEKILSFIIPSYNSAGFLPKCIESMVNATCRDKLEIIIVNDGSTDATAQVAKTFCDQHPDTGRLINQENKGHGGALNTGCFAATGKYLKVIDADDWVETQNLTDFVAFLETCDSDVVLTHHYTHNISNGKIKKWKAYPEQFGVALNYGEIAPAWDNFSRSLTFHGITYSTRFYQAQQHSLLEHVFYEDHEYATIPCCLANSITPLDLFIYDYRIGDVAQSVSDVNQLKRLNHMQSVLDRLVSHYSILSPRLSPDQQEYYSRKTQGVLLAYLTTLLLVMPDRKTGRKTAEQIMQTIQQELPRVWELANKQFRIFRIMNRIGLRKKTWDRILRSALYRKLRGNHNFD